MNHMQVNNFKIWWSYTSVEDTEQLITKCFIGENTKDSDPLTIGTTVKHPNDTFDKEKARKISLGRALQWFPKEERGSFWNIYRDSTRVPRW